MKEMTVGDLRKAIEGVDDSIEIVVRGVVEDEEGERYLCQGLRSAGLEHAHDADDTLFLALDAGDDDGEPT